MPLLLEGFLVALGVFTLIWMVSVRLKDASIVDPFWGPGFALVGGYYLLLADGFTPRGLLAVALVTVWGIRLGGYLLWRNWSKGEDYRYAAMRRGWGDRFWWVSLFTVFWLQALILWIVGWPVYQAVIGSGPPLLSPWDAAGLVLFAAGLAFESIGDFQLARFKSDPANKGKVLDRGLWRYTRHPNYFGDALVWWGLTCLALSTTSSLWTLLGPLLMTVLLMKVSGVALLEQNLKETKPRYRDYIRRTNAFFPWKPRNS